MAGELKLPPEIPSATLMLAFRVAQSHVHDGIGGELHLLNHLLEELHVVEAQPV